MPTAPNALSGHQYRPPIRLMESPASTVFSCFTYSYRMRACTAVGISGTWARQIPRLAASGQAIAGPGTGSAMHWPVKKAGGMFAGVGWQPLAKICCEWAMAGWGATARRRLECPLVRRDAIDPGWQIQPGLHRGCTGQGDLNAPPTDVLPAAACPAAPSAQ